eukprot:6471245-Amphidinium_carterae.2
MLPLSSPARTYGMIQSELFGFCGGGGVPIFLQQPAFGERLQEKKPSQKQVSPQQVTKSVFVNPVRSARQLKSLRAKYDLTLHALLRAFVGFANLHSQERACSRLLVLRHSHEPRKGATC